MSTVPPSSNQVGPNVLQLDWNDHDGVVTVTPRDSDRYCVKVRTAIDRLQRAGDEEAFQRQFQLLQRELAKWLSERDDVRDAFVTVRDGGLLFIVVTPNAEYDEHFEDELTDLDVKISQDVDLPLISMDVLSLPNASGHALETFLDPVLTFSLSSSQRPSHAQ